MLVPTVLSHTASQIRPETLSKNPQKSMRKYNLFIDNVKDLCYDICVCNYEFFYCDSWGVMSNKIHLKNAVRVH